MGKRKKLTSTQLLHQQWTECLSGYYVIILEYVLPIQQIINKNEKHKVCGVFDECITIYIANNFANFFIFFVSNIYTTTKYLKIIRYIFELELDY